MSSAKSLSGLMKWLSHDDWREAFFAVFDMHLRACDVHDVEPNELESLIGGAAFMNLWGCAFEDLLRGRTARADDQTLSPRLLPRCERSLQRPKDYP